MLIYKKADDWLDVACNDRSDVRFCSLVLWDEMIGVVFNDSSGVPHFSGETIDILFLFLQKRFRVCLALFTAIE